MGLFDQYPMNWNSVRKEVYRRDRWTCQQCGVRGVKVFAHHKVHISQGGSNHLDNLETVCRKCHEREHPHLFAKRIVFWIKVYAGVTLGLIVLIIFFSALFS